MAPINPLLGVYAAVTRHTLDDRNPSGWVLEEKISVEEAMKSYASANAYASFDASKKGSLETGKLADVVIWNGHPLTYRGTPDMVLIDGRVVFHRPSPGTSSRSTHPVQPN